MDKRYHSSKELMMDKQKQLHLKRKAKKDDLLREMNIDVNADEIKNIKKNIKN